MRLVYVSLLILWIALGTYLYLKSNKTEPIKPVEDRSEVLSSEHNTVCKPHLVFVDKSRDFLVKTNSNFHFQRSQYEHSEVSNQFREKLIEVAQYLDENPQIKMQIKGLYEEEESNSSNYENIGLARASSVKTYFLTLGTNSSQILTTSKLLVTECFDENNILTKGVVVAFGE